MIITCTRTGGLVGITKPIGLVDTSKLIQSDRAIIEDLANKIPALEPAPGADRMAYKITIDNRGTVSNYLIGEQQCADLIAVIRHFDQSQD